MKKFRRCWYGDSLPTTRKVLSADHPDLATSYNNIAITYYYLQDFLQAFAYFQKAIVILKKSLPIGHRDTKSVMDSMGLVLGALVKAGRRREREGYIQWYVEECR
ncbi:MAG: tetratricopeptide repeat protein [Bacteroidia bacterium]